MVLRRTIVRVACAAALIGLGANVTSAGQGGLRPREHYSASPTGAIERIPWPGDLVPSSAGFDSLVLVGDFPPTLYESIAFGDSDHDGRIEGVAYENDDLNFVYWIMEEQGDNVYTLEHVGPALLAYAIDDLDGDGKSEIIGQIGALVQVYESLSPTSYPTQLVWTSPPLSNVVGLTTTGDTDRDGRREIIHSVSSGGIPIIIFENSGDDTYDLVYSAPVAGYGDYSAKVIADLDGDGLIEIAVSNSSGLVRIYESPADNEWVLTWTDTTGLFNAYGVEGGVDTDGNGRPELFVYGNTLPAPLGVAIVYEAVGDNTFVPVAKIVHPNPGSGGESALGDLDGLPGEEYVMLVGAGLVVHKALGVGNWVPVGLLPPTVGGRGGVHVYDANRNGRCELFWDSYGTIVSGARTLIYEHPEVPSDAGTDDPRTAARSFLVSPNPCRASRRVSIRATRPDWMALGIYDAAGRRVAWVPASSDGGFSLVPGASGTYFLHLEGPGKLSSAATKLVVLR